MVPTVNNSDQNDDLTKQLLKGLYTVEPRYIELG